MDLFDEINQAIRESVQACLRLLEEKLKLDRNLLKNCFCRDGKQQTILNYLIDLHSDELNLQEAIAWLLQHDVNINLNQPLHLALKLEKLDLVRLILQKCVVESVKEPGKKLDLDSRDHEGKTLIYRILQAGDLESLTIVIDKGIDVNQPSLFTQSVELQPLHQAVIHNLPEAVAALLRVGAQLNNPFGFANDNALLLAARTGAVKVIEEILAFWRRLPPEQQDQIFLNKSNNKQYTAIGFLCMRLHDEEEPQEAIRGIAVLLCNGANVPAEPLLHSLLMDNRKALFKEVKEYTKGDPKLAAAFLRRCHNKKDPLHEIMYAKNSWSQALRHLFGRADDLAFEMEALIPLPDENSPKQTQEPKEQHHREDETLFERDEILFAQFVKEYKKSINDRMKIWKWTLFNPWSEMLHLIAEGKVTCWQHVVNHAETHPDTRTDKIVKQMMKSTEALHEDFNAREENGAILKT